MASTTPAYLPADFRYAGDDWSGSNALTFVVYATPPVYDEDGVVVFGGTRMDLTGFSVSGTIRFRQRPIYSYPPSGDPTLGFSPATPVGAILGDPKAGTITLSLPKGQTVFPPQSLEAWGDPDNSLLIVQPMVTDPSTNTVTVGKQPLFVF